jgi:hypothetical protein
VQPQAIFNHRRGLKPGHCFSPKVWSDITAPEPDVDQNIYRLAPGINPLEMLADYWLQARPDLSGIICFGAEGGGGI